MPLTSKNFTLVNSSPEKVAQLDAVLAYLQEHSPDMAKPILEVAAESNVSIVFSDPNVNPHDAYGEGQHAIVWNPNEGLVVVDSSGNSIGVQSAANGLFHEVVHSIDIDQAAREDIPNAQYNNDSEAVAVIYSDAVAKDCGEVQRNNYEGKDIIVSNVTAHTGDDGTGRQVWHQTNSVGQEETGPGYHAGDAAPTSGYHDSSALPGNGDDPYDGSYDDPNYGNGGTGNSGGGDDPYDGSYDDPNYGQDDGAGTDPYDGSYDDPNYGRGSDGGGGEYAGGGGDAGCVAIESYLPDGRLAGDIKVGDTMELADEETLVAATGIVGYSQVKQAFGYRIITETGASLVCSDTAPIPVRGKGLLTPDKLLGEKVAVRWDEVGQNRAGWEQIVKVEKVGTIQVQHITVGNKCFWAGEKKGASILHHNLNRASAARRERANGQNGGGEGEGSFHGSFSIR